MSKKYFALVAWLLVVAFPSATLMAESRGAMVFANGNVNVNGNKVGRSVSVFKGDTVETAKDSQVTLALNGSTVSLPANSGIRYSDNQVIDIGCGAAAVKTTTGLTSKVGGLTIHPSSRDASYDVVSNGKELKVAARRGDLSLQAGGKTVTVPAGQMATLPGNCALVAQNDPAGASGAANQTGSTVSTAAQTGAASTQGLSTLNAVAFSLITLGAIGGAIAVGLAATRERSGSRP